MKRILLINLYSVLFILYSFAAPKYIFYFIGDGMGSNQIMGAEMYRSAVQGEPLGRVQTLMTSFPYAGLAATFSASNAITDSPAAGTALAAGVKTNKSHLGLDRNDLPVASIAEELKADGWGVGIMTSVAIDHATPAAFYAHVPKRDSYYKIGKQLAASGFDFFGGAGFHHPEGKNDDKKPNLYRNAETAGYTIAHGYDEAVSLQQSDISKMIFVQKDDDQGAKHAECLPYAIDRQPGDLTLRQIVSVAIPFLDRRYDRFFMMVEGGMVDYACHGDDAVTAFGEVWDMDEALQEAYEFYLAHPDETLIVITADHETGGLGLGNGGSKLYLELLQYQKCSSWILSDLFSALFRDGKSPSWDKVRELYRTKLGFWDNVEITADEEKKLREIYKAACKRKNKDTETLYKTINQLSDAGVHMLNKKAHIGWTAHSHTAHAVPVFAIGVGAENFTGWHDNTDIVNIIRQVINR